MRCLSIILSYCLYTVYNTVSKILQAFFEIKTEKKSHELPAVGEAVTYIIQLYAAAVTPEAKVTAKCRRGNGPAHLHARLMMLPEIWHYW
jgi:hypothetical protein